MIHQLTNLFPDVDPDLLIEVFEERAAIREFEANYDHDTAEELAIEDLKSMFG